MLKPVGTVSYNPLYLFFYPVYILFFILFYSTQSFKYADEVFLPQPPLKPKDEVTGRNVIDNPGRNDGMAALRALGYSKTIALQKVSSILESRPDATPEEIVKIALLRDKN